MSYCTQEVYTHDRARFLLALFVPEPVREALLTLYALNIELARIPSLVSEEMIGHIRYAWWEEAAADVYDKNVAKSQPILQAIADTKLPRESVLPLIAHYREHYPQAAHADMLLDQQLIMPLLQARCPDIAKRWHKAQMAVMRHRERYDKTRIGWLSIKLLIAGF